MEKASFPDPGHPATPVVDAKNWQKYQRAKKPSAITAFPQQPFHTTKQGKEENSYCVQPILRTISSPPNTTGMARTRVDLPNLTKPQFL